MDEHKSNNEMFITRHITGTKTKFYNDVKILVKAGNSFDTIKTVGYDVFRHYYDDINKDQQVGSCRIKRYLKQ